MQRKLIVPLLLVLSFLFLGCATAPYKEGEFLINIWDYKTLPKPLQELVLQAEACEKTRSCASSSMIGAALRKCAEEKICTRSTSPVVLNVSVLSYEARDVEVKGQYGYKVPFGKTVEVTSKDKGLMLPVGTYKMYGSEWYNDKDVGSNPNKVPRMNAHFILR